MDPGDRSPSDGLRIGPRSPRMGLREARAGTPCLHPAEAARGLSLALDSWRNSGRLSAADRAVWAHFIIEHLFTLIKTEGRERTGVRCQPDERRLAAAHVSALRRQRRG